MVRELKKCPEGRAKGEEDSIQERKQELEVSRRKRDIAAVVVHHSTKEDQLEVAFLYATRSIINKALSILGETYPLLFSFIRSLPLFSSWKDAVFPVHFELI